jgi:hypothetical protein
MMMRSEIVERQVQAYDRDHMTHFALDTNTTQAQG